MTNPRIIELPVGRTNIYFEVVDTELMNHELKNLHTYLEDKVRGEGSAIVYVRTKHEARSVCKFLNENGMQSLEYHKGLTDEQRQKNQSLWMQNQVSTMVATAAFGLGINKKDVRAVIHWGYPADMESYFQEAGRAGRDGKPSWSRLYASVQNSTWKEGLLAKEGKEKELANFQKMVATLQNTKICRNSAFDEALDSIEKRQKCDSMCDVCFDPEGVKERANLVLKRGSFPLINQVADSADVIEDSEDEECPMEREVREKFSEDQEEYESIDAEEDKLKRRLGRRQEQDGSGDEGPYLAQYFHTCGNCKVENQANIFTHLDNNNACLEAYCQDIFATVVSDPKEQTLLELGLVMGACIHPGCQNPHYLTKNLNDHVKNRCRLYYEYFTRANLGPAWQNVDKLNDNLSKTLKALQKRTNFTGSSKAPFTARRQPMRYNLEAVRKRLQREREKQRNVTDPKLAMNLMNLQQLDVLRVPCCACQHRFSRPHQPQATSAIKPLGLDNLDEVDQYLRGALQGSTPEEHLRFDGDFWICSKCQKSNPPTTKFDGNLQIYRNLQHKAKFALKAMKIFDINNEKPVLVLAPSKFPTVDIDGRAAVLSSDFSWSTSKVMLPADMASVNALEEDFSEVLTTDWATLAKFMATQNTLPGIYTLPNILVNHHRVQIQKAKHRREEENKQKILAVSHTDQHGTRVLDKLDFTRNTQSNDTNVGEPDEEQTDDSGEFLGALSSIAGAADYFDARVTEVQSKVDTYGAVRGQVKVKVNDGQVDGKTAASLLSSPLVKAVPKYDDNDHVVNFDYYLRCTDDGIEGCDDDCQKVAHTPLDYVSGINDPNFVLKHLPLLARHVSATSENFINRIFKDRVQFYDFWHEYEDGSVYLVGNVWYHEYAEVNEDIAAGKIKTYKEAAEKIEQKNRSTSKPMVPKSTRLEKQTSEKFQGYPSKVDFFPKSKGKVFSEETKTNSEFLLQQTDREGLDVSLDECIDKVAFRQETSSSAKEFKFSFRVKSLSPADKVALFKTFFCKGTPKDITGNSTFELCKKIVKEEQGREEKIFSVTATPLLLYDALQEGKNAYLRQLANWNADEDIQANRTRLLSNLLRIFETSETTVGEGWKEITADMEAVQSMRTNLQEELGSDALNENSMLLYQTALDIHQSSMNAGYTTKRTCQETHVIPYEEFTSQAFDGQCEAKLVIRGDEEWTFKRPPVVVLQGQRHFEMPLLQLAQLKSFGKAPNRFSNTGPVRYVDLRNGAKVARSYREVRPNEDVGNLQTWKVGNKRFVLANGYRSYYLNLHSGHNITFAEFCAWYDVAPQNPAIIEDLRNNGGFLAPDRNEVECILKSEDESTHREALLPGKILLKDNKTTFRKRKQPVPLQWGSLGLENEYNETALFTSWKDEEDITLKSPEHDITHIYSRYFDGQLSYGANAEQSEDSNRDEGEDGDGGDGDEGSLAEDIDLSIPSSEDNFKSDSGVASGSSPTRPDFSQHPSQNSAEHMSQDENNFSVDVSQVSDLPASNPEFATSTPLRTSKASSKQSCHPSSKKVQFETSHQDSACASLSEESLHSQSSEAPAKPSHVDVGECSGCMKGWTHVCPLDQSQSSMACASLSEEPLQSGESSGPVVQQAAVLQEDIDGATESRKGDEYVLLLKEKERLLQDNPVASRRSEDIKARLKKIYNKIGKISKGTDVVHSLKSKASKPDREQAVGAEAIDSSLEAIIAEKEETAGRELTAKEKEYLNLQLQMQRILQISTSQRGKEEKEKLMAIRNRLKKIKPSEEFLKLPSKAPKSGAERNHIYRGKMSKSKDENSGVPAAGIKKELKKRKPLEDLIINLIQ